MANLGGLLSSSHWSKEERGLTIVETMVTIAVFSFLIVLCIGLFIFLGRIYYRGLYENRVQETARTVVDSVAEAIRTSGAEVNSDYAPTIPVPAKPWDTWHAYCIGNIQYSYKLNVQLVAETPEENESNEVFVAARGCNPSGGTNNSNPNDVMRPVPGGPPGVMEQVEKTELLADGMRLLEFSIAPVSPENRDFYKIRIKIAVGGDASDVPHDKTVFEYTDHPCEPHPTNPEVPTPVEETDCINGKDDRTDPGSMPSYDTDNGRDWKEPDTPANLIHQNDDTSGLGYKPDMDWASESPPAVIIYQCQDSESFCSVIEIETKVFRRIL